LTDQATADTNTAANAATALAAPAAPQIPATNPATNSEGNTVAGPLVE